MVGHAFRIAASCDSDHLRRHFKLLLLHYLEVAYDVYGRIRGDEGKLVEFIIFEELVFDLDDSLLSVHLAGEVYTDGDLVLDTFQVEKVEGLVYIFRRNVVEYRTVSNALTTNSFLVIVFVLSVISSEVERSV